MLIQTVALDTRQFSDKSTKRFMPAPDPEKDPEDTTALAWIAISFFLAYTSSF